TAGSAAQAADPVFPLGSRIGLVPPPGMVPSTAFQGFEDRERNVALLMSELPPDAFQAMEKAFTVDALKEKGVEAERREDVPRPQGQGLSVVAHPALHDALPRVTAGSAAPGEVPAFPPGPGIGLAPATGMVPARGVEGLDHREGDVALRE